MRPGVGRPGGELGSLALMFAVTVQTIAIMAGPMVGISYFLGAIQWRRVAARRGVVDADLESADRPDRRGDELFVIIEAVVPVLVAIVALNIVESVAPGSNGGFNASLIGALSNQIIPVWQSIALWCGAATVLGQVAPVTNAFRGTTGIPGVMALALTFAPWIFVATVFGFLASFLVTRNRQPALVVGLAAGLTMAWIAWVGELNPAWGVNHGPELALWTAVVMAMLAPRVLFGDEYHDPVDPTAT